MGDEPAGPNTAEPRVTTRSSDVAKISSFRRTPPPQLHESMGLAVQAAPSSESASKPPVRLAESEDVEAVACRQREAVGQVDREAAVERRELGDRQRPVLSREVAGKVQAEHAGGGLGEIAGDGLRARAICSVTLVGHGSRAAVDLDVVAERRIAAGEGQVAIADRDRPAGPAAEGLAGAAGDGHARLIVDLDIADDLAAVGDGPDRGVRAGAVDRVARRAARRAVPRRRLRSCRCWSAVRSCRSSTCRRRPRRPRRPASGRCRRFRR